MFKNVLSIIGPACIIGLHWYTGWPFILYMLGSVYVLTSLLAAIVVISRGAIVPVLPDMTKFQMFSMILGNGMYYGYFLIMGSYVLANLLVVSVLLLLVVRFLCLKK